MDDHCVVCAKFMACIEYSIERKKWKISLTGDPPLLFID